MTEKSGGEELGRLWTLAVHSKAESQGDVDRLGGGAHMGRWQLL